VPSFLAGPIERALPSAGIMFKVKSFQRRILLALLGVGLVPAMLLLLAGTAILRGTVTGAGTAGPWGFLAESGQTLLDAVEVARIEDPELARAAQAHREALSESLRFSRIFTLVADRVLALIPLLALALALLVGGLSYWVARQLSRGFSRPIRDLVGWAHLIAQEQPLPPPGPADTRGVREFAQLRDALRQMSEQLAEGRRHALQAEKLRSWTEMARRVAHELKNPLTPMRMAADSVSRLEGKVTQEAGEVLLEEIARLEEMARTFAQFGRMPEGPPSEVDLVELLGGLVRHHEGSGPELRFEPSAGIPQVLAHYDALLRCFRNLLLNAMEASGPDGNVTVTVSFGDGHVRVAIQDTGPGIPEDHMDRIWDPDFSTKGGGTGLGLAMVRSTIAVHMGRVKVRTRPEGGATFVVELPLGGPDSGSLTTLPREPPD
jgi:signal transduction histidine kinase